MESETRGRPEGEQRVTKAKQVATLLELNRETQRLSRSLQLAHAPKTVKTFTIGDFIKRFKKQDDDVSKNKETETEMEFNTNSNVDVTHLMSTEQDSASKPSLHYSQIEQQVSELSTVTPKPSFVPAEISSKRLTIESIRKLIKERRSRRSDPQGAAGILRSDDDDDDIEIEKAINTAIPSTLGKTRKNHSNESDGMTLLKALAAITSPQKKLGSGNHTTLTTYGELRTVLQIKAKLQAKQERCEKIEQLKALGIEIESFEQRQRELDEFEDLLEKARKDALEFKQFEKKLVHNCSDNDDADGSAAVEVPSSDEYIDFEENDSDESTTVDVDSSLSHSDDDHAESTTENVDSSGGTTVKTTEKSPEYHEQASDNRVTSKRSEPQLPGTDEKTDDIYAAFGFDVPSSVVPGLTQVFDSTMAEAVLTCPNYTSEPLLNQLAHASLPVQPEKTELIPSTNSSVSNGVSEKIDETQANQTQIQDSEMQGYMEQSQIPDPTQDAGFLLSRLPVKDEMGVADETQTTEEFSQLSKVPNVQNSGVKQDAFSKLMDYKQIKERVRRADSKRDKIKHGKLGRDALKEMFDEQAEESDDEYAGLGGDSEQDESDDEADAELEQMIDESEVDIDEEGLAAFHAMKERANDERVLARLFRDVRSGALRSAHKESMLDLSDTEDVEDEYRRRRQREFARKQKALLKDENIKELANNPKKSAFFKAIEDIDDSQSSRIQFLDETESEDGKEFEDDGANKDRETIDLENIVERPSKVECTPIANKTRKRQRYSVFDDSDGEDEDIHNWEEEVSEEAICRRGRKSARFINLRANGKYKGLIEPWRPEEYNDNNSVEKLLGENLEMEEELYESGEVYSRRTDVDDRMKMGIRVNAKTERGDDLNGIPRHYYMASSQKGGIHRKIFGQVTGNMDEAKIRQLSRRMGNRSMGSNAYEGDNESIIKRGGNKKSNVHYQAREAEKQMAIEKMEKETLKSFPSQMRNYTNGSSKSMKSILENVLNQDEFC